MSQPLLSVVIPVFNEESILTHSVERLARYLRESGPHPHEIVIANNGSADHTLENARSLAKTLPNIRVLHLDQKGRGRALKTAWLGSPADVLAYMDADLSADLTAISALIQPLLSGGYDLAIGSRLLRPELTTRCFTRELTSRLYNWLLRRVLSTTISDAQCGFKAVTRRTAQRVLPLVEDTNWFFDTELLVRAERLGFRRFELPVRWTENPNTHVKLLATVLEDLRGLLRLRRALGFSPVVLPP